MSDTTYSVGTVTVANGGTTVTGSGTRWIGAIYEGDLFTDPAQGLFARVTADATDDQVLQINAWPGTGLADSPYEVLFTSDAVRMSERNRQLLEQLSVVQANGRGLFYIFDDIITDGDPGSGKLRINTLDPTSATAAFIDNNDANGALTSAIIDTWGIPDHAEIAGQLWLRVVAVPSTFHAFNVMGPVVDGTGYRKLTLEYVGGSGSFAAGDELMVMFSPVGVGATGQSAYELAVEEGFVGTEAEWIASLGGVNWRGNYSGATAYETHDGVLDNGSSWRALQATTGNAPPVFPTTSNAYWTLVAAKGTDGAGTGDVVGPASSVADRIALFNGTTGKLLKDSGYLIADLVPAGYSDLLLSVSLLALQVADNTNVALFLGSSGNRVADSFDALTYVDVAGATNLDTSTTGLLKPTATGGNDSFTTVLLHFDGTDASTTFTDSNAGGSAKTWSAVGNGQIDTAIKKFGTAAGLFDSSGDGVKTAAHTDMRPGSGDFTIDCWFNVAGGSGTDRYICGDYNAGGSGHAIVLHLSTGNVLKAEVVSAAPTVFTLTGTTTITTSGWHHAALVRTGNTLKLFLDGVQEGGDVSMSVAVRTSASSFAVGAAGDYTSDGWNGSIDEFRFSKGVARWTANFTPPTSAYASPVTDNLTVRSASFTAASAPTRMKALLRVKEVDAATAGTDYTFECSRDGGTTWSTMTLTELFTSPSPTAGIRVAEAAETSVSGQPSGTSPRWRFKTLNNKHVELHDAYFYWS